MIFFPLILILCFNYPVDDIKIYFLNFLSLILSLVLYLVFLLLSIYNINYNRENHIYNIDFKIESFLKKIFIYITNFI